MQLDESVQGAGGGPSSSRTRGMHRRPPVVQRVSTAARWPLGVALTSWRYMWRTTPVHRRELVGAEAHDGPPALPAGVGSDHLQEADDGVGPLTHRLYRTRILGARVSASELVERITRDLDQIAPSEFARFHKVRGRDGELVVGDEYVVRMPGPWDGPVRAVAVTPLCFRLATLVGHLEAGQIEFRASEDHRSLEFAIESWARSGDRLSHVLYTHLRMAKEVQLHMWTSVLERVATLAGGKLESGIVITTRRVEAPQRRDAYGGTGPRNRRAGRRLAELAQRSLNFDPDAVELSDPDGGWHVDDLTGALPSEPSGPPVEGGSWETARELMRGYQVADPARVRATYRDEGALAGRDMLLQVRYLGSRFHVGVRVGMVYDETRELGGRQARVFGWSYRTLEGHFERGEMHYEVWKWLETGDVEFRVHAYSRVARSGPLLLRAGFRLIGRHQQLRFYDQACRRMRRLTQGELEVRRTTEEQALAQSG